MPQLAIRDDPRAIRKKDIGNLLRQDPKHHLKNQSLDERKPSKVQPEQHPTTARLKGQRNSMLAARGRESRRERTFIGSQCAACEEHLEHTLRGERILQLSCGHVAHTIIHLRATCSTTGVIALTRIELRPTAIIVRASLSSASKMEFWPFPCKGLEQK